MMSESSEHLVAEFESRIDAATQTLAELGQLTPAEAARIGSHIDRLASQISAISAGGHPSAAEDTDTAD